MTEASVRTGPRPASELEVCAIELRGTDGEFLRKMTASAAQDIVQCDLGEWRRARNGRRYVALVNERSSGKSRSWLRRDDGTVVAERSFRGVSAPTLYRHLNSKS
jgi:hypothetical protein